MLPLFTRKINRGEPIVVFGKEKVLDFTFVDDCVAGITLGIDKLVSRKVTNQTINLAAGEGRTLVDAVNVISLTLGKPSNARFEPARPGEVTRYVADISKARQLLGYEPQITLTAGIPKGIAWAKERGDL